MSVTPIRYARGNVLFGGDGQVAAFYRLPTVTYHLLPDDEKWELLWTLAGLAFFAKADLSIYRVKRRRGADDYVEQAINLVDRRYQSPEAWHDFLSGHQPHIEGLQAHLPEVYLRIAQRMPNVSTDWWRAAHGIYRDVSGAFGVAPDAPVLARELDALLDDEALIFDRVRRSLPGTTRMTTRELQWLCLRCAVRHVAEPTLDPWWRPDALVMHSDDGGLTFEPQASDFLQLFNAAITRQANHLVVEHEAITSFQAFLTLGCMPDESIFPGEQAELLSTPLDRLEFPIDAVMHCRWIANRKALSEVAKAIIDAENAIAEAIAGQHTPDNRTILNPDLGRELQAYLESADRPPMLNVAISYAVGAPDRTELRARVEALREQFTSVVLRQPAGSQEQLYLDHLPQPGGGRMLDYSQRMRIEDFGAVMPIATHAVGDGRGVHVAYTVGAGQPTSVRIDLTEPAANAKPTTIYMNGRQGAGKTNGALILSYVAAMRGSYVLTADPGLDHYLTRVPELRDHAETIGLEANEAYRGMLDPLFVSPPGLEAEIALSYYLDVLPPDPSKGAWETELAHAIRDVMKAGGGGLAVLEQLRAGNPAAQEVARALTLISETGLGILAFGDGSNVRRFEEIKRVTTITMAGIELPKASQARDTYDRRERLAVATFKNVAAYLMWLVTHDRSVHKVVFLDEAWALPGWLLDKLVRLGRKYNTTVIISSQTVMDLGELRNLIGMYFVFGVNGIEEARRAVELIGLDPEDHALCARLATKQLFEKGRCLFRDLDGNVAEVQIDAVYEHVLQALNTTPSQARKELVA